ncbi:MAG: hypothetical protein NTW49_03560 [Bacteroidia bacterium]|nr:hypothetical protein [Bacteroidia bacterium]
MKRNFFNSLIYRLLFLFMLYSAFSCNLFGQTITIGSGSVTGAHMPIEPYYGYTYGQAIYYQSEINVAGQITKISYYYSGSAWTDNITVYMGTIANTAFSSTSSWVPLSSLTQVYSGNLAVTATAGWYDINLQTPFYFSNFTNLVVCVDENTPGFHLDTDEFYNTTSTANRGIYYYNDNINPDPASPPTGTLSLNYPNIRLTFSGSSALLHDMACISWLLPQTAYNLSGTEHVKIRVQNQGSQSVNSFYAAYSINGGSSYVTETVVMTLTSGQTYDYIFNQTANFSVPGSYTCKAYVNLPADTLHTNDTVFTTIVSAVQGDSCNFPINYGLINSPPVNGATTFPNDAVWYSFTLDTMYVNVTVSLCGSSYDTYLMVENTCTSASPIASNDDYCGLNSQVVIPYLTTGSYIVKVYGYAALFGNYHLSVTGTNGAGYTLGCTDPNASNYNPAANLNDGSCLYLPDGNICQDPIIISLPLVNFQGTTAGYGNYYPTLPCGGSYFEGNDIVYRFTIANNGFLNGSVTGDWAGMAVLNSCPLASATCIASATGYSGGSFSNIPVTAGTYYVVVSDYPQPMEINFVLNLSLTIPGCTDSTANNYNPLANYNDGSCEYTGDACSNPLFYGFVNDPPVDGYVWSGGQKWYQFGLFSTYNNVEISLCNSGFDTKLEIWHSCNDGTYIIENDDLCGNRSLIAISTLQEGLYLARVSGHGNASGNYELSITGDLSVPTIFGCTDFAALNYNPQATYDDGSCQYTIPQNPGWSYTNTGSNHIILIPSSASILVNNQPVSTGDFIGVFYDSLGTLACGGYLMWQGQSSTIAAWGLSANHNGFASDEAFKWKIWRHAVNQTYVAIPNYMPSPSVMPNAGFFQPNGASGITSLIYSSSLTQQINLAQGWSIISTYITPNDPLIASVFAPVTSDLIIAKSGTGLVYWPVYGVNHNVNLLTGAGYLIKMQNQHILTVTGSIIIPEITPINLIHGWSQIAYLRDTPASVVNMMSSVLSSLDIIKNSLGQVYWPYYGLNNMGNMNPGEGYLIRMSSAQVLVYPPN